MLSMGLAAFPITAVAALGPFIVTDLAISRTAFGSVSSAMFVVAIILSLIAGQVVDRLGSRAVLSVLYIASGSAVLLFANASSLLGMLVAGMVVGIAQACANPATNAAVVQLVQRRDVGMMLGLKQSGVPLMQFMVGITLAPVAAALGWRQAFLLGLSVIIPSLIVTRRVIPSQQRRETSGEPLRILAVPPDLAWLFLSMLLSAMALQAHNVYLPLYAFEALLLSPVRAGGLVGVVGLVGMLSRVGFGRMAGRHAAPVRLVTVISGAAVVGSVGILVSPLVGESLLWISAIVFGGAAFGFNVVGMTIVVQSVDATMAGRVTGAFASMMFLGFATGPVAFGAIVDTFSYAVAWTFVVVLFVVVSFISLLKILRAPGEGRS